LLVRCSPAAPAPVSAPVAIEVASASPSASAVRELPASPPPPKVATPAPKGDTVEIVVLAKGSGPEAKKGDLLVVSYVGTLVDGTEFDSSLKNGRRPFRFRLGDGATIQGWDQGLLGMQAGEKRRIVIPSSLGYGERGQPPAIPPAATLVFEVELLQLNPP
jgi:FKBP-type peptidyl-prolyl cis-trans isomerase